MRQEALPTSRVRLETRPDGALLLRSDDTLKPYPVRASDAAMAVAARRPDQVALADRNCAAVGWRRLSYGALAEQTGRLGQAFIEEGLSADRPVMLVSENRIEAAVVLFAGYRSGVPVAPITPAFCTGAGDPGRLAGIVEALRPGLVIVDDPSLRGAALACALPAGTPLCAMGDDETWAPTLNDLLSRRAGPAFARAEAAVTGDTIAKILFTSGSTGAPKGVVTTHRMLASNQQSLKQGWPFLVEDPPILVDWLPWNHTFGGNYALGMALSNGGALYIDDGRPAPGAIRKSLANIVEIGPTLLLNVPRGLDLLATELDQDATAAVEFFRNLELIMFASAGLPARLWEHWRTLIDRFARRPIAFVSAWGATETAPLATQLNFQAPQSNNIGTPAAGSAVKLAPVDGRYELRVKGPNVTPMYLRRPDLTAAAFDDEGFFRTGDAGRLADPESPAAGILIEGRFAEDFKLANGTWVNVGGLRADLMEALGPIVRDVVISGQNQAELAAVIFIEPEQCRRLLQVEGDHVHAAAHATVLERISAAIARHNAVGAGVSRRIARHALLPRPPDAAAGELTEKGTVNQHAVLTREAALCATLHAGGAAAS